MLLQLVLLLSLGARAQTPANMTWFNEPDTWKATGNKLEMFVTPKSDYWRKTHYGFTVDDGPFYYTTRGGEFEAVLKVTGAYKTRYDQAGMMLRIDEKTWIKTGVEFVDGKYNFSTVHTEKTSSWSVIELAGAPNAVWIKAVRRLDAVEIFYSLDGQNYKMSNLCHFAGNTPVHIGMMAASPDGDGFKAVFEDFKIKHLPDAVRMEWLKVNQ